MAWLDVNVPAILSYLRYTLRARISAKYPRHKLGDDGNAFSPGQPIVTPKTLRGETIAWAKDLISAAIIEDLPGFTSGLLVERDASDRNRANARLTPNFVGGFRVFAAQLQYIL